MDLNDQLKKNKECYLENILTKTGLKMLLEDFVCLLDGISMNVFQNIKFQSYLNKRIRTCPGINASIKTLDGIKALCLMENIPDAFLLIRKLRDNLFLDLFLFQSQRIFEKVNVDYNLSFDFNNPDLLIKEIEKYTFYCMKTEKSEKELVAINEWKSGKLLKLKNCKGLKSYFEFYKYITYLKNNNT